MNCGFSIRHAHKLLDWTTSHYRGFVCRPLVGAKRGGGAFNGIAKSSRISNSFANFASSSALVISGEVLEFASS